MDTTMQSMVWAEAMRRKGINMNITKRIHERLKWWFAGDEMQALQRYKSACYLAFRWNGNLTNSAETADWIDEVGKGKRGMDIHEFREKLKSNTTADAPKPEESP